MYKTKSGFTIVELLIVIVIIAILAAITIVAYNGITARANDTRRMHDLSEIRQTLSLYYQDKGFFPVSAPNPGSSSWEISTDPGFLTSLNTYDGSAVFKDPINVANSSYWYHTFGAGTYGCPASLGAFYVLWERGMQTQPSGGGTVLETNGCSGQTLATGSNLTNSAYYLYFGFS